MAQPPSEMLSHILYTIKSINYQYVCMPKSLCKWKKKEIEKSLHELIHIVEKPRYICTDCARCAHDKNFLCKPHNIN